MEIRRLILQNWKNFLNVDVAFSERTFIIGANASGKSNLLDVFRFLQDISKQGGGLQQAVNIRGGIKRIRCLAARNRSNIKIEVHLAESGSDDIKWMYSIDIKHLGGGFLKNEASILSEKVWSRDVNDWILERTPESPKEDVETLKYTHLEQVTTNRDFREISNFFNEVQYLNIVPLLVRDTESYVISKDKEDFYGRNFLDRISKMPEKTRQAYFRRINDVLRIAVPQLEELQFVKDNRGIPHLEARYIHWRAKAGKQQEEQFSDGTLRLIGFLWALLDGSESVLLEEPEINLHAEIIRQLPEFIAKLQKRKNRTRQVIITTHSYDLLDNETIGPNEVVILFPSNEGTKIKMAQNVKQIMKLLKVGLSIAEATSPITRPKNINMMGQLNIFD